ncbi:39S ribosomal protein L55, mitochondrial isoform X1 [Accipiter gentilis]|uniref:39S ribosomal protein L55, mitochondrial isoform X1 n=2 Tax=Astur gentilis TaxID=8957 RepID=UPI002110A955|nr:39S ribosomal protein L55, mitochondrial isoform X1 [Accipiter gentilis]
MAPRSRRQLMAGGEKRGGRRTTGNGGSLPAAPAPPPPRDLTSGGAGFGKRSAARRRERSREQRAVGQTTGTCVEDPASLARTKMAATGRALSALRLDAFLSLLPAFTASVRLNSNRAAVSHLRRQLYGRLYPILLVKTDGSTVRLRYKEPKRILMLPLDSNTLPEAERRARLRRQFPSRLKAGPEETFEGIDLATYKRFWKK